MAHGKTFRDLNKLKMYLFIQAAKKIAAEESNEKEPYIHINIYGKKPGFVEAYVTEKGRKPCRKNTKKLFISKQDIMNAPAVDYGI